MPLAAALILTVPAHGVSVSGPDAGYLPWIIGDLVVSGTNALGYRWYLFGASGQTIGGGDKAFLDDQLTANGQSGFQSSLPMLTVDKIGLGLQLNKHLALDLGFMVSNTVMYRANGGSLSGPVTAPTQISGGFFDVNGILPVGRNISLLGRVGIWGMGNDVTLSGSGLSIDMGAANPQWTNFTGGIGVQYRLTDAVAARLDMDTYQLYTPIAQRYCTLWTLGMSYRFR